MTLERYAAGPISEAESAYVRARVFAGVGGKVLGRLWDFGDKVLKGANKDGLLEDLPKWMTAKRQLELKKRFGSQYLTEGKRSAKQIQDELSSIETRLGPEQSAKLKGYADNLYEMQKDVVRELQDSGMLSKEAVTAMMGNNKFYLPQQRIKYISQHLEDAVVSGKMPSRSFNVTSNTVIKQLSKSGSDEEVLDPFLGVLRNFYRGTILAERNRVARNLANLHKDPALSKIVRPYNAKKPGGKVQAGEQMFSAYIDGTRKDYIGPIQVIEAMKNVGGAHADGLGKVVRSLNQITKQALTTWNPVFQMRQFFRDYQTAVITTGGKFMPWHLGQGLIHSFTRDATYRKYMKSGAGFSGWFQSDSLIRKMPEKDRLKAVLNQLSGGSKRLDNITPKNILKSPFDIARWLSESVELGPRIGVYQMARTRGMSDLAAGFLSRNATVDFYKSGKLMRGLNQWIPFLNARTQGTLNILSAFKNDPARAALVSSAYIALPTAATYAWNTTNFPHIWDQIASSEKEKSFLFIYGDAVDESGAPLEVVKLPKGDIGKWMGTPIEKSLEWLRYNNKPEFDKLALDFVSDMSPVEFAREGEFDLTKTLAALPPAVRVPFELMGNRIAFFGAPVDPGLQEDVEPQETYRYTKTTSPQSIKAAEILSHTPFKMTPRQVSYTIGAFLGAPGRALMESSTRLSKEGIEYTRPNAVIRTFLGARGGALEKENIEAAKKIILEEGTKAHVARRVGGDALVDALNNYRGDRDGFMKWMHGFYDAYGNEKDIVAGLENAFGNYAPAKTSYERFVSPSRKVVRGRILADFLSRGGEEALRTYARWDKIGLLDSEVDAIALSELLKKKISAPGVADVFKMLTQPTGPPPGSNPTAPPGSNPAAPPARPASPQKQFRQQVESLQPDGNIRAKLYAAAKRHNVPYHIVLGQAAQESMFNQEAVSSKGATGIMQLMPNTARMLGVDPQDIDQNIDGGVRYLRQLIDYNKGDVNRALLMYHTGIGNVEAGIIGSAGEQYSAKVRERASKEINRGAKRALKRMGF